MAKRHKLPPDLREIGTILGQLRNESDRAAALIGAALLDDSLGQYIRSRFIDDDKVVNELMTGDVPLGTFSARIKLAYCANWIGQSLRGDLDKIRNIRNDFAHHRGIVSFETQSVMNRCSGFRTVEVHNLFSLSSVETARDCYLITCALISGYFINLSALSKRPPIRQNDDAHDIYVKRVIEKADLDAITGLFEEK